MEPECRRQLLRAVPTLEVLPRCVKQIKMKNSGVTANEYLPYNLHLRPYRLLLTVPPKA
eukprot:SAG31_NODE_2135_length_6364_cov_4.367438_8_plen_59_part_00